MADLSKKAIAARAKAAGRKPSAAAIAKTQAKDRAHVAELKARGSTPKMAGSPTRSPASSAVDAAMRSRVSIPKGETMTPIPRSQVTPGTSLANRNRVVGGSVRPVQPPSTMPTQGPLRSRTTGGGAAAERQSGIMARTRQQSRLLRGG